MSLVSNFIGNIPSIGAEGIQAAQNFDLNDTTFENLLQKQIDNKFNIQNDSFIGKLGMPSGFEIDGLDMPLQEVDIQNSSAKINDKTTSETVTFFTSLMDNKENSNSEIFDFAKKQATNLYNKYSKSIVTDISEFVEDIKNII